MFRLYILWIALPFLLLAGCFLAPAGTDEERARLTDAGREYQPAVEERQLPDLPETPTWQDVLHRAFLANGELEAAYFDWAAAFARIDQAANWPNSNLAPSFSYMFSGGQMKAGGRATGNLGVGPMQNGSVPTKTARAGRQARGGARGGGGGV